MPCEVSHSEKNVGPRRSCDCRLTEFITRRRRVNPITGFQLVWNYLRPRLGRSPVTRQISPWRCPRFLKPRLPLREDLYNLLAGRYWILCIEYEQQGTFEQQLELPRETIIKKNLKNYLKTHDARRLTPRQHPPIRNTHPPLRTPTLHPCILHHLPSAELPNGKIKVWTAAQASNNRKVSDREVSCL